MSSTTINNGQPADNSVIAAAKGLSAAPNSYGIDGAVIGSANVNADVGSLVRSIFVDLPAAANVSFKKLGNVSDGFAYQAMGLTTAFNTALGVIGVAQAGSKMSYAMEMRDNEGVIDAGISIAQTTSQLLGGLTALASRITTIGSIAISTVDAGLRASKLLGRVSLGISKTMTATFGVFYGVIALTGVWNMLLSVKFYIAFKKADASGQFEALEKMLNLSDGEKNAIAAIPLEKLIAKAKEVLPKITPEMQKTKQEWEEIFSQIGEGDLATLGTQFFTRDFEVRRENKFKRALVGIDKNALITEIKSLANSTSVTTNTAPLEAVVKKVKTAWVKQAVMGAVIAGIGTFGVAATVAGAVFLGPLAGVAITLMMILAVTLPMTAIDAYSLVQQLKEKGVGKHDKKLLVLSTAVALFAISVSLGLTVALNFAILPILLTIALGAVWLGSNGFSYAQIRKFEKEKEDNPPPANPLIAAISGLPPIVVPPPAQQPTPPPLPPVATPPITTSYDDYANL